MIEQVRKGLHKLATATNLTARRALAFLEKHEWDSPAQRAELQKERLGRMLAHACKHVPYYRKLFEASGVSEGGRVHVDRFPRIPIMTRRLFRDHFEDLKSDDLDQRRWYANKTGGSTGEPLSLIQERADGSVTGTAVLRWFYGWHGVRPGDREIKLWGSDRDLFYGSPPIHSRIKNYFAGVRLLNAFKMTRDQMRAYVDEINRFRPKLLRGYCANLYELACFAEECGLKIAPPDIIISSAGKLYPPMRQKMEAVYGCKVFDHYGSREVHNVAMECEVQSGLHVSDLTHLIEVVNEAGLPCPPGIEGRMLVTTFGNYAMPLIRYDTGDRAILAGDVCRCGRNTTRLREVVGRSTDCFRTREGRVIPGEFFIYLLVVSLKDSPFAKVQAVQDDYEAVRYNLVLRQGRELARDLRHEIEKKTRVVMGDSCRIEFRFVDEIESSASGKYRYTICQLRGISGE
jgi:phenylacetate-CoA ligase